MTRSKLRVGLIVLGVLGLASAGCQNTGSTESVRKAPPDDPTAWSDKVITRDDPDAPASSGLPKSSRKAGTWSSEAQDVERSLGVMGR